MKLIRNDCFETNSSSNHSITLGSKDTNYILDTIYPDENGDIEIKGGAFGRWFERSNDTMFKLRYAATSTLYGLDIELLRKIVIEHTGCNRVVFDVNEDDHWIDHESQYNCPRDEDKLKNFLFNKNSWLFISHNEGTPEPGFYDALPIYTENGVIEPNFQYKLTIRAVNKSFKFIEYPTDEELDDLFSSLRIRFNATINRWECDPNYFSSRDIYYKRSYYYKQDYSKRYVVLIQDDFLSSVAYRNDVHDYLTKSGFKYLKKYGINKLLKHRDFFKCKMKLHFKIEKI